ncbi:hypothetical protein Heshes_16880 [Alicyclobacillus hesperidum]|uniref:Uncharacterized protein n=1 Tax=Alicyclobacillus hesperidum TaxID=89784 RepID=A0AA37X6W2_9BACL|nr:hypothetical protein Heshes_16880 [Alicyclobacillus hesperidum]
MCVPTASRADFSRWAYKEKALPFWAEPFLYGSLGRTTEADVATSVSRYALFDAYKHAVSQTPTKRISLTP